MKLVLALAALAATAAGCVHDAPVDRSLDDQAHPANPAAPAASRPIWDDPFAAPRPVTSQPAPPMDMPMDHSHHQHGGMQ